MSIIAGVAVHLAGRRRASEVTPCIMFSRDRVPFCAVCRRAIAGVLDMIQPALGLVRK